MHAVAGPKSPPPSRDCTGTIVQGKSAAAGKRTSRQHVGNGQVPALLHVGGNMEE
jgi:hypothetical protein